MRTKIDNIAVRVLLICLAAAITRILPHPVNFGPLTAIALFAGYRLGSWKMAIPVAMLAAFLSDVLVNALLYNVVDAQYFLSPVTLSMYGFYMATSLASTRLNLNKTHIMIGGSLIASLIGLQRRRVGYVPIIPLRIGRINGFLYRRHPVFFLYHHG